MSVMTFQCTTNASGLNVRKRYKRDKLGQMWTNWDKLGQCVAQTFHICNTYRRQVTLILLAPENQVSPQTVQNFKPIDNENCCKCSSYNLPFLMHGILIPHMEQIHNSFIRNQQLFSYLSICKPIHIDGEMRVDGRCSTVPPGGLGSGAAG